MAGDRVHLPLVQTEHPPRPVGGVGAVDERVHVPHPLPAGVAAHVPPVPLALPVVAEKVVEQGRPGQRPHPVLPQTEPAGQPVGALGRVHRVGVQGILPAVVGTVPQLQKKRMGQNIRRHLLKTLRQGEKPPFASSQSSVFLLSHAAPANAREISGGLS